MLSYVFRKICYENWLLIGNSEAAGTQALNIVDKLQALCLSTSLLSRNFYTLVPFTVHIFSAVTRVPQKQNLHVILGKFHLRVPNKPAGQLPGRGQEAKLMECVPSPGFPGWAVCASPRSSAQEGICSSPPSAPMRAGLTPKRQNGQDHTEFVFLCLSIWSIPTR